MYTTAVVRSRPENDSFKELDDGERVLSRRFSETNNPNQTQHCAPSIKSCDRVPSVVSTNQSQSDASAFHIVDSPHESRMDFPARDMSTDKNGTSFTAEIDMNNESQLSSPFSGKV